jgi:PAS domain S-box-containing protein
MVFVGLLILFLLVISVFFSTILLASYSALEEQYVEKDLNQAVNKLDDELFTMSSIASDWGPWDDTVDFVNGNDPNYINSNLQPYGFDNLNLNLIVITNTRGEVLFSGAYDPQSRLMVTVPVFFSGQLDLKNPLMNMSDPHQATTGIVMLPEGPMLVVSQPIVHSDFSGPSQGVVIMGRYLNKEEIARLAELTRPSLTITRTDNPVLSPNLVSRIRDNRGSARGIIQPLNGDQVAGYALIRDIYGNDALVLQITESRDIYHQGVNTTLQVIFIILAGGLILGLVLIILLNRVVLKRIGILADQVHEISKNGTTAQQVIIGGNDELSDLALEINRMLETIEHTQQNVLISEARFRDLAEQLPLIIFEMDTRGNLQYVNKAGAEIFGITEQKIAQGLNIRQFLSPESIEQMQRGLSAVMSGSPSPGEVYSLQRLDGICMQAIVSTSLIKKEGKIAGFRGIVVDITERVRLEFELEENSKLIAGILQASPDGVFRLDSSGHVTFVNETFTKITGISFDTIRGKYWADILPMTEQNRVLEELGKSIREQRTSSAEMRYIHPDGTPYWLLGQTVPIKDKEDNLIGWVGTLTDISEQKFTEDALKENEEYLKSLIHSIRAGIIVVDAETHTIIDVNPAALEMMGTVKDAVVNQRCTNVICPADVGRCPITDLGQTVDNAERILRTSDGREISIIKSVVPVMLHGTSCLLETFIDNSYRKEIELKLAQSEEKYRALTENTPDILFSTDMHGIITYVSPQVNKYGFLAEEVIGKSLRIFIHPADIDQVESNMSRELEEGAQFISRFRIRDKWGTTYWFEEKSSLRLDISGNPIGMYGILRDVSERKRVEDAIDIANKKLNLMNQITRHDILNTITGLLGCLDMAKATHSPEEKEQLFNDIRELTRVIQRHITFTRQYQEVGVHLPQWQNVNDLLNKVVQNFEKSGITFSSEFEKTEIYADPLLEKVFYNLIDNAIRYGVTITTISIYPTISDKGLSLVFEDNGVGVEDGQKREIFKRGVGKNTGMGLFLTAEILAITGITIEENGIFGTGARFDIRIPNGTWRLPPN